jgi:hypothetical protein
MAEILVSGYMKNMQNNFAIYFPQSIPRILLSFVYAFPYEFNRDFTHSLMSISSSAMHEQHRKRHRMKLKRNHNHNHSHSLRHPNKYCESLLSQPQNVLKLTSHNWCCHTSFGNWVMRANSHTIHFITFYINRLTHTHIGVFPDNEIAGIFPSFDSCSAWWGDGLNGYSYYLDSAQMYHGRERVQVGWPLESGDKVTMIVDLQTQSLLYIVNSDSNDCRIAPWKLDANTDYRIAVCMFGKPNRLTIIQNESFQYL